MKRTRLNICGYLDYRQFLKDRLEEMKTEDSKFSQRYVVKRLGLSTNNYLQRVIDAQRKLSSKLARKLAEVIGLASDEASFFLDLVRYGHAKTTEDKVEALERLRRNRRFTKVHKLEMDRFDYFDDPLSLAIRNLVATKDFKNDPQWIARRVRIKATPTQVKTSLERLERLGQLVRDEEGELKQASPHQGTGERLGSVVLRNYHLKMLKLAGEAMELDPASRHFRGLTMSLPEGAYEKIVDRFSDFLDDARSIIEESGEPKHVYHMEMSLFPLTHLDDGEGDNGDD